jgi:hypothetical protein
VCYIAVFLAASELENSLPEGKKYTKAGHKIILWCMCIEFLISNSIQNKLMDYFSAKTRELL